MSCNAGRPHKTSKNTDTSKNRHHHCWCYVFITQEKHISSAVRTELDLRGDVSGSTASSHATDHELLEIKVRTLLHCLPAGCPVFVPVKWVMPVLLFLRPECWFLCGYYFKVNLLLWHRQRLPSARNDIRGNEGRNSILITCYYTDLDSTSDWFKICFNQLEAQPRLDG